MPCHMKSVENRPFGVFRDEKAALRSVSNGSWESPVGTVGRIWDGVVSDIGTNQMIDIANRLIRLALGITNSGGI